MNYHDDVWVIIPAFNESKVIGDTVADVLRVFPNVLVIDDCSNDNTAFVALAAGARVCRHPINLGQGAALQTGFEYAIARNASSVVTFDADGQHSVEDARAMVNCLASARFDVVLGSRFLSKKPIGMKPSKKALLKAAILYTNFISGLKLTDTHNGLRALSATALRAVKIRHNRMAHASEILNEIGRAGLRYTEIPCEIRYTDYSMAKGQKMSGAVAILMDLFLGRLYR